MSPFSDSQPVELSSSARSSPPSQSPQNQRQGLGCLFAFCSLFSLVGLYLLFTLFLKPAAQIVSARNWAAVACRIDSSVLTPHRDSDGTTYSADIVYSYVYGGQSYSSGRTTFSSSRTGGYNPKLALVSLYPAGSTATCYVNPNDPNSTVLQRGFTSELWTGLGALPFLLFGVGGLVLVLRQKRQLEYPTASWKPKNTVQNTGQPVVLRAQSSPWGRFVGLAFITAFWDGIVGFGVWKFVIQGDGGRGFSIFGALFFIPFVLVGLLLLAGWFQALLALGNARPVLNLSPGALRVGESGELLYELRGGLFVPKNFEISLEGREEATFTRGTDSVTSKSTFFFQTLAQSSQPRGNRCIVTIPGQTMHSMETPHNKILWVLRLHGPIRFWADVSEEWTLQVEPARSSQGIA